MLLTTTKLIFCPVFSVIHCVVCAVTQSAAVKLSDARRDAATVVNRPRRPLPLVDGYFYQLCSTVLILIMQLN